MAWTIVIVEPVRSWLHDLRHSDRRTLVLISAAVDALAAEGPALGRPLVDTVRGSKLANLKESRPGSAGSSEVRLLFVFDPVRQAVLLVGGDKAGNWQGWYRTAIPIAETAYAEHLRRLQEKDGEQ
ncbi:type II toxin-antitoxin system RelE/ParE family toxin [Dactylosporangium aurantiacum]|uniref:Type II toxin-antitoxin system RelE/ParE family toxin n=1 Tax=Dactylosporangium aurantiacum TaxID=35754 RepID=A0A9Q9IBU1_9ACTN|nr:type II toxin-antitoxin system RelE/ParE family toxin [Dactylosporangium aurantiacum]